MTMKEVAKFKEENEILKKAMVIISRKIINSVNINNHIYGIKKLCKILDSLRSTYYAKLNHTASNREIKNKKIKAEIIK